LRSENGDEIVVIVGKGKKKVLFYNEKNSADNIQVEEDIVKYWRDVDVGGMDETKVDDYLEKQGIASMKDVFARQHPGGGGHSQVLA